MLNKFEGNDPAHFACGVDAFENFDLVASGARDIGRHAGPPWYDGLVYETIRGISDLLAQRPDPALKARVDGYIARIEAAQKSDPDGFVGTNTQLTEDNHRWGAGSCACSTTSTTPACSSKPGYTITKPRVTTGC